MQLKIRTTSQQRRTSETQRAQVKRFIWSMNNLELNCTKNTAVHTLSLRLQKVFQTAHTENKLSIRIIANRKWELLKIRVKQIQCRRRGEFQLNLLKTKQNEAKITTKKSTTDQVTATSESVFGEWVSVCVWLCLWHKFRIETGKMTVTYTAEVATCRGFGCFLKLLFRYAQLIELWISS